MDALRKRLFIVFSTLFVLLAGSLFVASNPVHAATSYTDQTLVGDLGLPNEVVSVMVANSLDANGNTPSLAASAVTVGDIAQWQTVSLARRTRNADGTYTSATSPTVAAWIAGLKTNTNAYVETSDMLLYQDIAENRTGNFTGPKMLTDGIAQAYGRAQSYTVATMPVFNKLMAVLMCAADAKTIDLTGIVSGVADAATRVKMLAMFRTVDMKHLTEFDLGYNTFGPGLDTAGWGYDDFRGYTLSSSSVQTWNLSYEGLTTLDSVMLQNIGGQTRNVNLASNSLTTINWNNQGFLTGTGDNGSVNLGGNTEISAADLTTVTVLLNWLGNGSSTVLPDTVANAVIIAAVAAQMENSINANVLNNVADQLTANSLITLVNGAKATASWTSLTKTLASDDFDVSKIPDSVLQAMSDEDYATFKDALSTTNQATVETKKGNSGSTGGQTTGSVSASGAWQFVYQLGTDATAIKGIGAVNLAGTLPQGQSLTLSMAPWTSGKQTITPTLSFNLRTTPVKVTADGAVNVIQANGSGADMPLNLALTNPTMSLTADQVANLSSQANFNGVLVWTIQNVPSSDS